MARPLRIEYPGAVYHVTSRGNEKKPVFKNDHDRENFLNSLQHVNKRYTWICHAYCLMTNHYHLLIETPDGNLSTALEQMAGLLPDGIVDDQRRPRRRLSEAMEQHGYRQSELARHVDVHCSTISRWLREYENARRKT